MSNLHGGHTVFYIEDGGNDSWFELHRWFLHSDRPFRMHKNAFIKENDEKMRTSLKADTRRSLEQS